MSTLFHKALHHFTLMILLVLATSSTKAGDHADNPGNATLIPTGSTGVTGTIEIDIDVDWFQFIAVPSIVYTIQVHNVSLWDNAFALQAFAEGDVLRATNSAFGAGLNRIVWTNQGGVRSYYIGVSAMFEFTTGTYSVAVSTNDYDSDGDGLADAWETSYFGTITNAAGDDPDLDGLTTRDEYLTGTNPNAEESGLRITNIVRSADTAFVTWPGVSFATYRIESTTNLLSTATWHPVGTNIHPASAGPSFFNDTVPTNTIRHYRVIYE
jgi:hypothetical protein